MIITIIINKSLTIHSAINNIQLATERERERELLNGGGGGPVAVYVTVVQRRRSTVSLLRTQTVYGVGGGNLTVYGVAQTVSSSGGVSDDGGWWRRLLPCC